MMGDDNYNRNLRWNRRETENESDDDLSPVSYHYHDPDSASFDSRFQINNNPQGLDQAISHSLNLNPQGVSPIGLTLRKSTSLINLVEITLSQESQQKQFDNFLCQPISEKLKASNFPAIFLQIGSWKRVSKNGGDLVAKLYYAKKKLVWEFLDSALKSKIEIQWSEISAIRAVTDKVKPGCLEIELNQPPQYGREIHPQPRKHTQWKPTADFTGGQASICRRHSVVFPPGVLDKHFEKLLQCDNRLRRLSQQPFPHHNSPYFVYDTNTYLDGFQLLKQPNGHFLGDSNSNPPTSVTKFPHLEERVRSENQTSENNRFQVSSIPTGEKDHPFLYYGQESCISVPQTESQLEDIRNHLLINSQMEPLLIEENCHTNPSIGSSGMNQMGYVRNWFSGADQSVFDGGLVFHEPNCWLVAEDGICDHDLYAIPSGILEH